MTNNPHEKPPSGLEVLGWLALLVFTFWLFVWGIKYIVLGILWFANLT
jgi:hypothetical protein